jgi:hypothetical protein
MSIFPTSRCSVSGSKFKDGNNPDSAKKNHRVEGAILVIYIGTIEEKIYQRQVMKSGLAGGLESAGLGSWAAESAHFTPEELRKGCRVKRSFMIHQF